MNRPSVSLERPASIPLSTLAAATFVAVVIALLSALMMDGAQAQTTSAAAAPAVALAPAAGGSSFLGMMQGLVGLVIVLGVIFAAGWLLKKIGPRARASGVVQVLGGASVGPREKVVVVRFDGQTLLLGVATGHVSLLHRAETSDALESAAPPTAAPRFVDRLRAARSGS